MEPKSRLRRALWWAVVGIGLEIPAVAWDYYWHTRVQEGGFGGWEHVREAHTPVFLATVLVFAAMMVAVRVVRAVGPWARVAVIAASAGATADLAGQLWDNTRHAVLLESEAAHNVSTVGWVVLVVGLVLALVLTRRRRGAGGEPAPAELSGRGGEAR